MSRRYASRRYAGGLGPSRIRTRIPTTRQLGQWVSLRKILRFRVRLQLSQSRCLSLLLAMSGRVLQMMYNIFRLLMGVPDYSSSESYGEKQKMIGFVVIISLFHRGVSVNNTQYLTLTDPLRIQPWSQDRRNQTKSNRENVRR